MGNDYNDGQVINGYSGISSRYNLCPNGKFLLNQRGRPTAYTNLQTNQYMCDMWQINQMTFDLLDGYVESETGPTTGVGAINFRGHGKAGSLIYLRNIDRDSYGLEGYDVNFNSDYSLFTAAIVVRNNGAVPIEVGVAPKYNSSGATTMYQKRPIIRPGEWNEAVAVYRTHQYATYGHQVFITSMEDSVGLGGFTAKILNFRTLAGGFRNPPRNCPVNLGEDMARCERYYQKGNIAWESIPIRSDGASMYMYKNIPFRTHMAGTPSMTVTCDTAHFYQLAELGTGSTANDQANWTPSATNISARGAALFMQRIHIANRSVLDASCSWTASI